MKSNTPQLHGSDLASFAFWIRLGCVGKVLVPLKAKGPDLAALSSHIQKSDTASKR
jgi:hypothetical protein